MPTKAQTKTSGRVLNEAYKIGSLLITDVSLLIKGNDCVVTFF